MSSSGSAMRAYMVVATKNHGLNDPDKGLWSTWEFPDIRGPNKDPK